MTIYDDLDHAEEVVGDAVSAAKAEINHLRGENAKLRRAFEELKRLVKRCSDWDESVAAIVGRPVDHGLYLERAKALIAEVEAGES